MISEYRKKIIFERKHRHVKLTKEQLKGIKQSDPINGIIIAYTPIMGMYILYAVISVWSYFK